MLAVVQNKRENAAQDGAGGIVLRSNDILIIHLKFG